MAVVSERHRPTFEEKTPNALKADRVRHRVTFNPNKASPEEILRVAVPKLEEGVVLVPGSLDLVFNLTVSGEPNNFLVNNVTQALVSRMVVKFAGETLQDTNAYDVYKLFEDLFLPVEKRSNMFLEGIQSEDLCKIRSNAGDKKKSGVDVEKKLAEVYGSKYRIPLDHEILIDHGVFYPRALADELVFEIKLNSPNVVVRGTDPSKLGYELTDIQLEYEAIYHKELAREVESTYINGETFFYEYVHNYKTITVKKASDTIIKKSINVPKRSLKGLLLLFSEPHAAGARDTESFFNPDITNVKISVNGIPNKVYSQGVEGRDMWEEVLSESELKELANNSELASVMEMLEAEPGSAAETSGGFAPMPIGHVIQQGPDIPAMREQLAILVSTGKAKEAIGVQLTYEQAREAQKKAAVEAAAIIAKEKEKKSASAKRNVTPPVAPALTEAPPESSGLSTNQWISLLGIGVTIVTTYAKREDIKALFNGKSVKGDDSQVTPESGRVENTVRKASALPSAISLLLSKIPQPKRGIRSMD
ncbi:hypothetical protein ACROYT_G040500 [Oculina patagonica]